MIHRRTLVLGLGLAGCASPEPKLYTLVMKPGAALAGPARTITVRAPVLPRYVEQREIIRRDQGDQMKRAENDWWSEPLGDMIRRVLIADLAQRLPAAKVLGNEGIAGDAATMEVELELQRFDTDATGRAVLTGFVGIEAKGRPRRLDKLQADIPPMGDTIPGRVEAMSAALARAADDIAASLAR